MGRQAESVIDGFEAAVLELPEQTVVTDGFEAATVELPRSGAARDGFEVSMVQLPEATTIVDGWASGTTPRRAPAIDGWSYAALSTETQAASAAPAPTTGTRPASPPYELIALAAALAATLTAGAFLVGHRRHHHLPV